MASNTAVATNAAAPTNLAAKLEPLLQNTPASAPPQPAAVRPMSVPTSKLIEPTHIYVLLSGY